MQNGQPRRKAGRPPWKPDNEKFTERYTVLLTPEQKEYVMNRGGGAFLRSLIDAEKAAKGEQPTWQST